MAKYLLLWELDKTKLSEDLKERKARSLGFQDIVRQQLAAGELSDWGAYVGELNGYAIAEGAADDVHTLTSRWVPWVSFQTREVLTIERVKKATEAM